VGIAGELLWNTPRLVVRPRVDADFEAWAESELAKTGSDDDRIPPERVSRESFKALLSAHRAMRGKDANYHFGAFERASGRLVGACSVYVSLRFTFQSGILGYGIHSLHRGRGLGKELVDGAIELAFRCLSLHRLEAHISPANLASLSAARAAGMREEGLHRRFHYNQGAWEDTLCLAITSEERGIEMPRPQVRPGIHDL
jgi:[ribosomal protein S5]-alanine N-acetyltransferase